MWFKNKLKALFENKVETFNQGMLCTGLVSKVAQLAKPELYNYLPGSYYLRNYLASITCAYGFAYCMEASKLSPFTQHTPHGRKLAFAFSVAACAGYELYTMLDPPNKYYSGQFDWNDMVIETLAVASYFLVTREMPDKWGSLKKDLENKPSSEM